MANSKPDALSAESSSTAGFDLRGRLGPLAQFAGVLAMLALLFTFFAVSQETFATWENIVNIFEASAVLLVISVGLTFTLLVAGFDLSISGVLALSGVILAKLLVGGMPTGLAIGIVLLGGMLIGVVMLGIPIAKYGISFFIMSLGVLVATQGLALLISNGTEIGLYDYPSIRWIGTGTIATIPVPVVIGVIVFLVAFATLRYTGFGRMVYAVGGNTEAARLAGINVIAVRVAAYAICATCAAAAGIIEAGRLAAANATTDRGIELTAATAVLIGGTSFVGGAGGVVGTLLGVLFLGVLQNGLIVASISIYWQGVITGGVLLASVAIDRGRQARKEARDRKAA